MEWHYIGFASAFVALISYHLGVHFGIMRGYKEMSDEMKERIDKM